MSLHALHIFDLALCRHVKENVLLHNEQEIFARRLQKLDPRLVEHLTSPLGTDADQAQSVFLLNSDELAELIYLAEGIPMRAQRYWLARPVIYRKASNCTAEINQRLAPAEGRQWAEDAARFTGLLRRNPLEWLSGLQIIADWLAVLRHYMAATGDLALLPRPGGTFPTPTNSKGEPYAERLEEKSSDKHVARMLAAIEQHPNGPKAKATSLIKTVGINRTNGLKALHVLQRNGLYEGFGKSKADRESK